MPPRTRRRTRAGIVSAATSLALLGLVPTVTAGSAQAEDTAFAPQLVTVDTPTREHKRLLQSLGLDLTEHAGHDYVEVVLHTLADRDALRAAGIVYGTVEAYQVINPVTGSHFGGSLGMMPGIGEMGYIAVTAFVINVVLAVVLSAILNATKVSNGRDETIPFDYFADADDPRVKKDLIEHDTHDEPYGDPDDIAGNAPAR